MADHLLSIVNKIISNYYLVDECFQVCISPISLYVALHSIPIR